MSFRNTLTENVILPISDFVLGQSISKHLKFLMKSQWWTKAQLEEYQNERLKLLIMHAYEHTQYYNELFKELHLKPSDIKTKDDLYKIPIITKEQLRENIKNGKLIADNIPQKDIIKVSSSGSTGEPLQFSKTKDSESFNKASAIRGWYWMGYKLGDKYVKLSQNPRPFMKKIQDFTNNCYYMGIQQLTGENFNAIVEKINNYKPSFVRGYPDPMLFLANYVNDNNLAIHNPNSIATTGNILFENNRKKIEKVFGCKIFDSYSCEGGANVSECNTHDCYHSSMEYAITEILDNNNEVTQGEKGRVITTDLHNFAVPFIRYDTQDYVVKSDKECSCGRKLLAIERIEGRDSDILISPTGKFIIVHIATIYFEWIDSVEQFQVRQNTIDNFEMFLKVNNNFNSKVEEEIYNYWKNYIGDEINIDIRVVSEIPLTKSGKRRFLIRDKSIKL